HLKSPRKRAFFSSKRAAARCAPQVVPMMSNGSALSARLNNNKFNRRQLEENKMFTKKVLVSALFAAGMLGAAAMPQTSIAAIDVYVNVAPPAERYERIPEARRGYVWSPGYWDYRKNKHVWVKGSQVRE